MITFKEHISQLDEVAIQFGRKAYPKFGQVVILAGGSGSGKGFISSNLLSIEGKVFDVDEMKRLAIASSVFSSKVKAETGVDLKKLDLRKPDNVSKIHEIIGGLYKVDKKIMSVTNQSVLTAHPDRKPNLIFDVTLKDLAKLESITRNMQIIGYDKKDIHLVWVMNKFDVAVKQNAGRARVVPEEILLSTHEGASLTFAKILSMGGKLNKYMDGDIFIAFNQAKVDSDFVKSDNGGSYIKRADYVHVKEKGKPATKMDDLANEVKSKIKSYVPKTVTWG